MRATPASEPGPRDLRRAIERLDALPMRASTARLVLSPFLEDDSTIETATLPASTQTDPAWALETSRRAGRPIEPLDVLARHRWWPASASTGPVGEALGRLWRHSAAVAFAARRLAREAGDPDPEAVARAGLLPRAGALVPGRRRPRGARRLVRGPGRRRAAATWSDAGWASRRHDPRPAPGDSAGAASRWSSTPPGSTPTSTPTSPSARSSPAGSPWSSRLTPRPRLTPWAPGAESAREFGPIDPRVRILTAEVQARCGGPFVEPDASTREERLTRDNARLRLDRTRLLADQASKDRFFSSFADSSAEESPEAWAERAGLAWCGEPGIAAARVVWAGSPDIEGTPPDPRPPSIVLPLGEPARPCAFVHLWQGGDDPTPFDRPATFDAWDRWAREVAERARLGRLLDEVVSAHRGRVAREEPTRHRMMLDALAEFAAGAGHELNNPLAVIVGRAQLLMARDNDPEATRSLRAIIAQAQRAARILRDLMYVARPAEPRPRPCQPEEIVRASLRDLQGEAEARGVRIVAEAREPGPARLGRSRPAPPARRHPHSQRLGGDAGRRPGPVHRRGRRPDTPLDRPRQRPGDRPGRGSAPLRPVLLRSTGGPRAGPRTAEGRPDRRAGRRGVEVAIGPGTSGRRSTSRSPSRKSLPWPKTKGPADRSPTGPCPPAKQ